LGINNTLQLPLFFFKVSSLCQFDFCPKRSKIELFKQYAPFKFNMKGKRPMAIGNRLHYLFSYPLKNFDRVYLKAKLGNNRTFEKRVDNIVVRGRYDDLEVITIDNKKYTILLEVKTTSKKYIATFEIKAAIRQLQLYMWLMKEDLEKFGFPLWENGLLEIYSQRNGELLRRIPVYYDLNIEDWIRYVVECFKGLKAIRPPDRKICKFCPRRVKAVCSWYKARMRRGKDGYM